MTFNTAVIVVLAQVTWYGDDHAGNLTASGEPFDPHAFTCASWLYPLGTELTVRWGGEEVVVVNTDRSDHKTDLDLSMRAFEHIAPLDVGRIQAEVVFDLDSQTQAFKDKYGESVDMLEM